MSAGAKAEDMEIVGCDALGEIVWECQLILLTATDAEAGPLLRQSLAIRQKILGPEHPDTLKDLRAKLAAWQQEVGDPVPRAVD